MALSDLKTALRLEYHDRDVNSPLLEDEQLERALRRSVISINKDLKLGYVVDVQGNISPDLEDEDKEILLLSALSVVCRMMQAKTARNFSFSSGDKKVNKTKQPAYWAELGSSYQTQYNQAVYERNPEFGSGVPDVIPQIYGLD